MVFTVATQRATAAGKTFILKLQKSIGGRRDIITIEVNQMWLAGDPMRVVTSRAGGPDIDDMLAVRFESLICQNAPPTVAFVAKSIAQCAFGVVVRHQQLSLQQGFIRRTMRAPGAAAAGSRPFIAVMAIGALYETARCMWRQQAGNVRIFSGPCDGMKGLIRRVELLPRVGLHHLPVYPRLGSRKTVRMATEAKLVLVSNGIDGRS